MMMMMYATLIIMLNEGIFMRTTVDIPRTVLSCRVEYTAIKVIDNFRILYSFIRSYKHGDRHHHKH